MGAIQAPAGATALRSMYGQWLDVAQPVVGDMDEYVTEGILAFPGGCVERRHFSWSSPLESVFSTSSRCYMLNLMLSGSISGGATRSLTGRGGTGAMRRLMLIPPDQTLLMRSDGGRSRSILCLLDTGLFDTFLAETPRWREDEDLLHAALNIDGGEIEWLLRRMHRELDRPDFATPQVIQALATQLIVEIIRALALRPADEERGADFHRGGLAPWRMRLIRQRLANEAPLPSLQELADLCDITVRHLSRAFRSETGGTLGRRIETVMVDRAKRLLSEGRTVRHVAAALGYANPGSFTSAFRRATGLLPRDVSAIAPRRRGDG